MKLLFFFSLLCSSICLALHQGRPAHVGEFPSTVRLGFQKDGMSFICSGVKISPRFILTAAHCFGELNLFSWDCGSLSKQISIRTHEVTSKTYGLKGVHVLPDLRNLSYSIPGIGYRGLKDIAVVEVDRPLGNIPVAPFTHHLQGDSIWFGGFGQETINATKYSPTLKVSRGKIGKKVRHQFQFDQTNGAFLLHGDSGGPVYQKTRSGLIVIGVNSNIKNAKMRLVHGPGERSHWEPVSYDSLATALDPLITSWIVQVAQQKTKADCLSE